METPHRDSAFLLVSLATLGIAFKGVFAKLAYADGASVTVLLLLRFGIAVPLFWAGALPRHRGERLGWREWAGCAMAALLFFSATLCDFTAISLIGADVSRIVLFTYPMFVILFGAIRDRTWPRARHLLAFAIAYAGLWLVVLPQGPGALAAVEVRGLLFALGSAVSYAGFLVASQQVMKRVGSAWFTAVSNTLVLGFLALYAPFALTLSDLRWNPAVFGWGVLIALVCTVIPFFLLFEGIRRVGATRVSLIALAGPVITVAAAWWLLGETLSGTQLAGLVLVIAAVGALNFAPRRTGWSGLWRRAVVGAMANRASDAINRQA